MIASETNEGLLLGPHLIDNIFGRGYLVDTHRPDAILLTDEPNGSMKIAGMWEFKSGKVKGDIPQKIRGFKRMLDKLRNDPTYFGQKVRDAIADHYPSIPPDVIIPPAEQVNLTFITSFVKKTDEPETFANLDLRVRPKAQRIIEVPIYENPSPSNPLPAAA
jgi:hypothetical protein